MLSSLPGHHRCAKVAEAPTCDVMCVPLLRPSATAARALLFNVRHGPSACRTAALSRRASRSLLHLRPAATSAAAAGTSSTGIQQQQASLANADGGYGSGQQPQQGGVTVAELDLRRGFREHWSAEWWRRFNLDDWVPTESQDAPTSLSKLANTLQTAVSSSGVLSSSEAQRYWAYHLARMGFFMTQGISGLLATEVTNRVNGVDPGDSTGFRLNRLFSRGASGPVSEALGTWAQDFQNIQEGKYNLPWDMTTPGHRQFSPSFVLGKAARFLSEATGTLVRKNSKADTNVWISSPLYPDYYLSTFHYQTDGWLSNWSARIYETTTETLFVGRQDAMQRQTLVPLSDFMAGRDAASTSILEVACGTGRVATFVKDNWATCQYTALDLSPFYLEEARRNMRYWKRMRAPDLAIGGLDGTGTRFLQAPAEAIPEPDESHDVVFCVYLFHELPADVRRKVAQEMARVCKPGGMVILTDSVQRGDRPVFDKTLGNFGDFNEPYYRSYIETDLGELFCSAGLVPDTKLVGSTTKVLSFRKPEQGGGADADIPSGAFESAVDALINGSGGQVLETPPTPMAGVEVGQADLGVKAEPESEEKASLAAMADKAIEDAKTVDVAAVPKAVEAVMAAVAVEAEQQAVEEEMVEEEEEGRPKAQGGGKNKKEGGGKRK